MDQSPYHVGMTLTLAKVKDLTARCVRCPQVTIDFRSIGPVPAGYAPVQTALLIGWRRELARIEMRNGVQMTMRPEVLTLAELPDFGIGS